MADVKLKPVKLLTKKGKISKENGHSVKKSELKYKDGLEKAERERYESKLGLIKGQDPYEIVNWSTDVNLLPAVTYRDVINFLVFTPSPYTADDLRCFKGLDAYNQFVCGWLRETASCVINNMHLTTAKVMHSQRLSEPPLRPWIIAEKSGEVRASHCTCMAGCGETCTHVASLLFYVESAVKIRDSKTVTEEKAYWKLPAAFQGPSYVKLKHIDFSSAKSLKKKLDAKISEEPVSSPKPVTRNSVEIPSADRLTQFLKDLNCAPSKPAILSLIPAYSDKYIPKVLQGDFPSPLTELKNEQLLTVPYSNLFKECNEIEVSILQEQIKLVEAATRDQARSKLWHRFRAGRVTASRMKAACRTNETNPSASLITSICYPMTSQIQTKAMEWGCSLEKVAREMFLERMSQVHENVHIENCGFFISHEHPYIGASSDAIISCDCCGTSTVEVKCPYCHKGNTLLEAAEGNKKFCLIKDKSTGDLKLDTNHEYFYQVQTQLGVCGLEMGYFVVWTEKDLFIESFTLDESLWKSMCLKAQRLFKNAILPELVGKWYTRQKSQTLLPSNGQCSLQNINADISFVRKDDVSIDENKENEKELWCFCQEEEYGDMICCDNESCKIQWFHQDCLNMVSPPKGKWFCEDCKKKKVKR